MATLPQYPAKAGFYPQTNGGQYAPDWAAISAQADTLSHTQADTMNNGEVGASVMSVKREIELYDAYELELEELSEVAYAVIEARGTLTPMDYDHDTGKWSVAESTFVDPIAGYVEELKLFEFGYLEWDEVSCEAKAYSEFIDMCNEAAEIERLNADFDEWVRMLDAQMTAWENIWLAARDRIHMDASPIAESVSMAFKPSTRSETVPF